LCASKLVKYQIVAAYSAPACSSMFARSSILQCAAACWGHKSLGAEPIWELRMSAGGPTVNVGMSAGGPTSFKIVASTSFNAVNLLPKGLRFEQGGDKLSSCPGCHLTSLRPVWLSVAVCNHI